MQAWDSSNIQQTKTNTIPKIAIGIPYNGKWESEWVMKTFVPLNFFPDNLEPHTGVTGGFRNRKKKYIYSSLIRDKY